MCVCTYPLKRLPRIINRNRILVFRRQSILDVKHHTIHLLRDAFAKLPIRLQIPKHPPPTVEVDIRAPLLGRIDGTGLVDSDLDGDAGAAGDGAGLLGYAVDGWADGSTVRDQVFGGVGAEVGDGDLVGVEAAGVVGVVVGDVDGVEAWEKLGWDAVDEWLGELGGDDWDVAGL